ncbi:uncharacterized protein DEA37_0002885, partial [Paragonimus westermani]
MTMSACGQTPRNDTEPKLILISLLPVVFVRFFYSISFRAAIMSHAEHMKMMPTSVDTHKANSRTSMMHMKMYFNTDLPFILLFGPWEIDSIGKLIGAFIGVLLLAALYEACS